MVSYRALIPLVLAGALAAGCSKSPAPTASSEAAAAATPADSATESAPASAAAMPSDAPAAMAAHAPTAAAAPTAATAPVQTATGKVVETMDAGGYTYVRLDTGKDQIWAATSPIKVKVGQELTVPLEMPMQNFRSATLKRDFPVIYFASRVSRGGEPLPPRPAMPTDEQRAAAGPAPQSQAMPAAQAASGQAPGGQAMPPGHPPLGGATITVTEVIPPAPGGHTVADVWAKRTSLAGKTVVVRGKVVKFLSGIMGRNWVHLQDGTGKAADGTGDLTVTTDADAKVGDIVTATGTLAIDKDFGAGYKYGAIVEAARLVN